MNQGHQALVYFPLTLEYAKMTKILQSKTKAINIKGNITVPKKAKSTMLLIELESRPNKQLLLELCLPGSKKDYF